MSDVTYCLLALARSQVGGPLAALRTYKLLFINLLAIRLPAATQMMLRWPPPELEPTSEPATILF